MLRPILLTIVLLLAMLPSFAQDTLVCFDGRRIPALNARFGKMKLRYTDPVDSAERRIPKERIYFIRYADGHIWPEEIGKMRQRKYRKTVLRASGDSALANNALPSMRSRFDTIVTMDNKLILALGSRLKIHSLRYRPPGSEVERRMPTGAVYRVRFASGQEWPPKRGKTHERQYQRGLAAKGGDWSAYEKRYSSARNQILFCAPGLHQSGDVPGISVGIAFDRFVDSRQRLSVGIGVTRMWAGTLAGGKFSNGERRSNVQSAFASPGIKYHLGDRHSSVDPFAGINLTLGSYRRYEQWMTRNELYRDAATTYFIIAPQVEMGVNLVAANRFTAQFLVSAGPQFIGGRPDGFFATLGLVRLGFRL